MCISLLGCGISGFNGLRLVTFLAKKIDRSDVNYLILGTNKVNDTFDTDIFGLDRFD